MIGPLLLPHVNLTYATIGFYCFQQRLKLLVFVPLLLEMNLNAKISFSNRFSFLFSSAY